MTHKVFNLIEALAGKPVITKGGISVSNLIYNDNDNHMYALQGYLKLINKELRWSRNGKVYVDLDLPYDLIME